MEDVRHHGRFLRAAGLAWILPFLLASAASADQVTLAWDRNQEADLAGFRIYIGTASRTYSSLIPVGRGTIDPTDNSVFCTLTGLTKGVRYFCAAAAFDRAGHQSALSKEVSFTIPLESEDVATPSRPSGPSAGGAGEPLVIRAAGGASSEGHTLQYRLAWGDGTASRWLRAGGHLARHIWAAPGTYRVRVQARCAAHRRRQSAWSQALTVTIGPTP